MKSKGKFRLLKIFLILLMASLGPMPVPWIEKEQISKVKTEQVVRRDEDDDEDWEGLL